MNQRIRVLQELGERFEQEVTRSPRRGGSSSPRRMLLNSRGARGWLQRSLRAVPVLLAVAAAIVVAGVALIVVGRRHSSPASSPNPGGPPPFVSPTDPALKYVQGRGVMNSADAGCHGPGSGVVTSQTDSHAAPTELLPILSVLRRPKRPSDKLPPLVAHRKPWPPDAQVVYVNYIRLARIQDGHRYYLIPIITPREPGVSAACAAAWRGALRRELPHIPASLRARAERVLSDLIALQRYDSEPHQAISFLDLAPGGGSGGESSGATAWAISEGRGGGMTSQLTSNPRSPRVLSGLVPDGVATITLRFRPRSGTPLTTTVRPFNNVFVLRVPRGVTSGRPQTVVWRNADGSVIETISRQG